MRIIQLTDIHLGLPGEQTRGVDTRKNFFDAMKAIQSCEPDLLVISGDICYKAPVQEIYDWVDHTLDDLSCPIRMIAGNHDAIEMISNKYLPAELDANQERYFAKSYPTVDTDIIYLDTHDKVMGDTQFSFLQDQLQKATGRIIIFMHHPPVLARVGYMDLNHAFDSRERFAEVVQSAPSTPHIFTGHYHVEKTISAIGAMIHITPSTFFQIKHDQDEFGVDHHDIGFRIIDLDVEKMMHRVIYLPGNLLPVEVSHNM